MISVRTTTRLRSVSDLRVSVSILFSLLCSIFEKKTFLYLNFFSNHLASTCDSIFYRQNLVVVFTACVCFSFAGGLFDGSDDSETFFKYAASNLNSQRDRNSVQIRTSELILHETFSRIVLIKNTFLALQHQKESHTEMNSFHRKLFAK